MPTVSVPDVFQQPAALLPGRTLAGRRVLVTGASGFLGTHLCRMLVCLGADVYAVSRVAQPPAGDDASPRWLRGDLADVQAVGAAWHTARPDVVFHLASHGVGSPEVEHVLGTLHSDLVSTVNVLTEATRNGAPRVVLAASLEEPATAAAVPASPYAAAKWAATGYARMFYALYGTALVITRPFMTYGPGQRAHKLIPQVIRAFLRHQSPRLSSGRRLVDWVYVDDVVRGLVLAAEHVGIEGAELDLGSGRLVPVRDVVERLAALTEARVRPQFGTIPDRPREVERRADAATTFTRLGWHAEIPLEEGLQRTVEWHRTHGGAV